LHNDEEMNKGNLDIIGDIYTTDYVFHDPTRADVKGLEGEKQFVIALRTGFPDLHFTIDDRFIKDDKLVVRWTVRGTHKGVFMGIPPTDKQGMTTGISIHRFSGGKIQESWNSWDALGMLQRLGVIPSQT
jgi:steroid delta-isomerase-like uncharacterized protein